LIKSDNIKTVTQIGLKIQRRGEQNRVVARRDKEIKQKREPD